MIRTSELFTHGIEGAPSSSHPELCIVTRHGADHPLVRSFAAQCVERGILLAAGTADELPASLPAELAAFKAIVLDQPALEAVSAEAELVGRLNAFGEAGGCVFRLEDAFRAPPQTNVDAQAVCDVLASAKAEDVVLHAGLTRNHPGMVARQLARDPFAQLPAARQRILGQLTCRRLSETTQHVWKVAERFCEEGDTEMEAALADNVRQIPSWDGPPLRGQDEVAGGATAAWLVDATGETAPLEAVRRRLDWLMDHCNRAAGVLTQGIAGNALGFPAGAASEGDFFRMGCGARRNVTWTESVHRYCPGFGAAYRITGEGKYMEEALGWVEHLRRCHLREDGLLAHCARDGNPATGAWARGQNHALYGVLYLMEELGPGHPSFDAPRRLLETVLLGLAAYQDGETGLWRNLVDHPDARLESSGTCAFVYILARCLNRGWLAEWRLADVLDRAWHGLRRMMWRGGLCAHCRGTAAGDTNYYLARPQGWSQAPLLIPALLEMRARSAKGSSA